VTSSASPTVRRRRLAAELRRLRGSRTGTTVAKALGWSPAKVSRYELGQGTFPLEEIEKLLDYYGVTDPRRAQLLALAAEANERAWWYDYADALSPQYMEFIGLEAEADSELEWQVEAVPGLLQTEEYARAIHIAHQQVIPMPPGKIERRVRARMIRQEVLTTRNPPLGLSVVIDEAVLLRRVGNGKVMQRQLRHLAEMAQLPNVDLRVLSLGGEASLMADSFVLCGFSPEHETSKLGDVAMTEGIESIFYVEGETDTYIFRRFFQAFVDASLSPGDSQALLREIAERHWK
jgi:transcriptional regulator with XRE-family HTH domain